MTDMAELGFDIDSRPVRSATSDVRKFGEQGEETSRRVEKSTAAISKGYKVAAVAVVGLMAAVASLGTAISTIREFESSVSRMGAISGATTKQLRDMRNIAKELGSTTEFTAKQAADGLTFLSMAGFKATESIAALPAVLDLATASGMGLAQAADTASNIMSGFGIAATEAAKVADVLAAASSRANTDVAQLGAAMSTVAPVAKALDISLADTAAAIGVLSDAGIQGARAGTSLRGVFASLAGPTKQAKDVLAALGLSINDVNPEMDSMSNIMGKLSDAGISTAQAMEFFGREAASGALVLIDANKRLGEFGQELRNVDGAASQMASTIRDNLGGDIDSLQSSVSGLLLALGEAGLTAAFRAVVQATTDLVRGLTNIIEVFSGVREASETFKTVLDTLVVAFTALAATQIPAVAASLVTLTAGLSAGSIATGIFTTAVTLARGALIALGGPLGLVYGILGASAAAWYIWQDGAEKGTIATYDADLGTRTLLGALDEFYETAAPAAGAAAINLANDNHKLAASAFEAAKAELAKNRALLSMRESAGVGGTAGSIKDTGITQTASTVSAALARVEAAEASLAQAMRDRKVAANAVTGSMSEVMAVNLETEKAAKKLEVTIETNADAFNSAAGAAGDLNDELTDAQEAAQRFAEEMQQPVVSAIESASRAFGDLVMRGFKDFQGFVKSIVGMFKNMLAEMIGLAVRNKIMLNFGTAGSLAGGGAAAGVQGIAAPGGGIGGIGSLPGIGGLATSFIGSFGTGSGFAGLAGGTGLLGGAGNVIGGFASGGFGGAASALGSSLAGATSGLAGFGAALGAIAVPLLAVTAIFSFFKTKTKQLDAGLRVTVDGMDALVETFNKVEKKKFWGLSKKVSTSYDEAEESTAAPLRKIVADIQNSMLDAASNLGIGSDAFADFAYEMKVSTKGLSEEDALKKIEEALADLGDAFAGMVPDIEEFQRAGEGAATTLTRLSSSLMLINDGMDLLGHTLLEVSLQGGEAASQMVDVFGGLEQASTALRTYFAAFYTQEEQMTTTLRRLGESFQELGVLMPQSRDQFRDLVESIDTTTQGGRELYASLISMAGAMDQVLPRVSAFTIAMQDAITTIQLQVNLIAAEFVDLSADALRNAQLWNDTARTLRRFLNDLLNSELTSATRGQVLAGNRSNFEVAMMKALAGDAEAARELPIIARDLLQSIQGSAATAEDYRVQAAQIISRMDGLAGASAGKASEFEAESQFYDNQLKALEELMLRLTADDLTADDLSQFSADLMALIGSWDGAAAQLGIQLTEGLEQPISALQQALNNLQDAIEEDRLSRERQARLVSAQAQLDRAEGWLNNNLRNASQIVASIRRLEDETGVTIQDGDNRGVLRLQEDGTIGYRATHVQYQRSNQAGLDAFSEAFWADGGLEDQIFRANRQIRQNMEWLETLRARLADQGIPSFATGGTHTGGAARIGENDIEMVAPSRIYNPAETRQMLGNAPVVAELKALREEVESMRSEQRQLGLDTSRHQKKTSDTLTKFDREGLPAERTTT